jgi:hypothetical protein
MNRWRAEYDDGIWRFYRDGMELGLYDEGDVVVDALNAAESRVAKLEGKIDQLTAHDATERQDDKSSNNVATPIDVALRKRIAKLEEKQRWIPVSERLPEDMRNVLGLSRNAQLVVSYIDEYKMWYAPGADMLRVTHWMPLPEPPIVYGKVCEE